jgi:hypothetical protein
MLSPSCSSCFPSRLRHGSKARYGWVANPCENALLTPPPTGTFTLPDTPSFCRRDNDTAPGLGHRPTTQSGHGGTTGPNKVQNPCGKGLIGPLGAARPGATQDIRRRKGPPRPSASERSKGRARPYNGQCGQAPRVGLLRLSPLQHESHIGVDRQSVIMRGQYHTVCGPDEPGGDIQLLTANGIGPDDHRLGIVGGAQVTHLTG